MLDTLTSPYTPEVPPHVPDVRVQPPLVYVQPVWEYKHIAVENPPDEAELNALGTAGWELVGVFPGPNAVHCYFKRLAR